MTQRYTVSSIRIGGTTAAEGTPGWIVFDSEEMRRAWATDFSYGSAEAAQTVADTLNRREAATYAIGVDVEGDFEIEPERYTYQEAVDIAVDRLNDEPGDASGYRFYSMQIIQISPDGATELARVIDFDGFGCVQSRRPIAGEIVGLTIDVLAGSR